MKVLRVLVGLAIKQGIIKVLRVFVGLAIKQGRIKAQRLLELCLLMYIYIYLFITKKIPKN